MVPSSFGNGPLRFASILLGATLVIGARTPQEFRMTVFVLAFAHYFMALWYSRNHWKNIFRSTRVLLASTGVLLAGALLYQFHFPIVIYFAIHHAFNEVYMMERTVDGFRRPSWKVFRASAVAFHLFAYGMILHQQAVLAQLPIAFYCAGLALSLVAYLYGLSRVVHELDRKTLIDFALFDAGILLLAGLSMIYRFSFAQVILYHFLYWTFYPLGKMMNGPRQGLWQYGALTMVAIAFFYALSPMSFLESAMSVKEFTHQFVMWGYVHITVSFILSTTQPAWINRFFRAPLPLQTSN